MWGLRKAVQSSSSVEHVYVTGFLFPHQMVVLVQRRVKDLYVCLKCALFESVHLNHTFVWCVCSISL